MLVLGFVLRYQPPDVPRRRSTLTQIELAVKADVGIATIAQIEAGEIEEPRVSTLRKLADALGLEPRDLLED